MRTYLKCIAIALFWGILLTLFYFASSKQVFFSDIIEVFSFSRPYMIIPYIIDITVQLLPYLLFQILFGTYIYRHFCSASYYYFSRCTNRTRWLLKEVISLYSYVLVFLIFVVASGTAIASITNTVIFDTESLVLFVYYLVIYSF